MAELDRIRSDFEQLPHPTVWAEMKRQRGFIPELRDAFARAPETLEW